MWSKKDDVVSFVVVHDRRAASNALEPISRVNKAHINGVSSLARQVVNIVLRPECDALRERSFGPWLTGVIRCLKLGEFIPLRMGLSYILCVRILMHSGDPHFGATKHSGTGKEYEWGHCSRG